MTDKASEAKERFKRALFEFLGIPESAIYHSPNIEIDVKPTPKPPSNGSDKR